MIKFLRDAGGYKKGMVRDLGTVAEAALILSGDAVREDTGGRVHVPAGGTSVAVRTNGKDAVVVAVPGNGGTMTVEATWSPASNVDGGDATWFAWDLGAVSAASNRVVENATAVRFKAATAAGFGEVSQ